MPKPEMSISTTAFAVVTKTVKKSGNTGHIYLDGTWIGKEVMVLLKERPDEEPIQKLERSTTGKNPTSEKTVKKTETTEPEKFEIPEKTTVTGGMKIGKKIG